MDTKPGTSFPERIRGKLREMEFTEWTFTVSLFATSLTIVLGKLALRYATSPSPMIHLGLYNENFHIDAGKLLQSTINASIHYEELVSRTAVDLLTEYFWFLKALMSGVAATAVAWFIIYKDSHVPGLDPPSPFFREKYTYYSSRSEPYIVMHLNYMLGLVIGLMIFIYMCF